MDIEVLVPVGLINAEGRDLGNGVSALFVGLPVGLDDALDVLKAVSAEVGEDERHHQALAAASFCRHPRTSPPRHPGQGAGIMHSTLSSI